MINSQFILPITTTVRGVGYESPPSPIRSNTAPVLRLTWLGGDVLSGDDLDFGSADVGVTRDFIFTIHSDGTEPLAVGSVTAFGSGYSIIGIFPTTIAVGGTAAFTLRYNSVSSVGGEFPVTVVISSTAPNFLFNGHIALV